MFCLKAKIYGFFYKEYREMRLMNFIEEISVLQEIWIWGVKLICSVDRIDEFFV